MNPVHVPTRAETQAKTRSDLLAAAAELFLTNGYHDTSLGSIAAASGRTRGAVYSNFENKEALCREFLEQRYTGLITELAAGLMGAGESPDERLGVLSKWWMSVSDETALLTVTADYALSLLRDPEQHADSIENLERVLHASRAMLEEFLPEAAAASEDMVRTAISGLVATGTGLVMLTVAGVIDPAESTTLFVGTIRMGIEQVAESTQPATG